ncbi:hypothetical protein [Halomicrococcus sp. NG-SE-24]|uniref:hypothetical protein n=1 Tax=Halomicrococcus sp. NG-SE-24 TaxID=3436928 RepID=UPI003D9994AF
MVSVIRLDSDAAGLVDEENLTPAETGVVNLLAKDRCTPAYVADQLAIEPGTAGARLSDLCERDVARKVYRGLYELADGTPDPHRRPTERLLVDVPYDETQFSPTERGILNLLAEGRAIPAYLAQELDVTQGWAKARLRDLSQPGPVRRVHRGLYELDARR